MTLSTPTLAPLVTVVEAADILGVPVATIRELVDNNEIESRTLILRDSIDSYIAHGGAR